MASVILGRTRMSTRKRERSAPALAILLLAMSAIPRLALASNCVPSCGAPVSGADIPYGTDCLFILRAAVHTAACNPECICRLTGSEAVSVTDALACLRSAVGAAGLPVCDCAPPTTTTTLPAPAGNCDSSGVSCTSKFDCEEECFGTCEAAYDACYAPALAEYDACFATCLPDDMACVRLCVLRLHTSETACVRTLRDCTAPCSGALCSGLYDGPRFEDTGLTVIDHQTKLEWEKKTADTVADRYTWTKDYSTTWPNGTVFTSFLADLNDCRGDHRCFAGHCDWRLPTSGGLRTTGKHAELESLLDLLHCNLNENCIDPLFGPISDEIHWSRTTSKAAKSQVWAVELVPLYPRIREWDKYRSEPARAVRDLY